MTPTIISELTNSSFRIIWNHSAMENEAGRTLYLYEGSTANKVRTIPNISLSGSHLFTGLSPDVEYIAQIATGFENSSILSVDTTSARTLPIEQPVLNVPPEITANKTQAAANKVFLAIGLLLLFFGLLKAAINAEDE